MSTSYIPLELNYNYHPYIFYKKNINLRSKTKSIDKLAFKLRNLMTVYK